MIVLKMLGKRFSRKGQREISIGTLLLIILGVVALVIVIIGTTKGFGFIFDKFEVVPGQSLESVVQSCGVAASNGLKADYCRTIKEVEISGVNQFVTCDYSKINSDEKIDCDAGNLKKVAQDYCASGSIKAKDFDKTLVNGETCSEQLGFGEIESCGIDNEAKPFELKEEGSCAGGQVDVTDLFTTNTGKKCCLVGQ
jgi:hypothetical protein